MAANFSTTYGLLPAQTCCNQALTLNSESG